MLIIKFCHLLKEMKRINFFSLVELLIVISIFAILSVLLLASSKSILETSRKTACSNQLKQFGFAFSIYQEDERYYPHPYNHWYKHINQRIFENSNFENPEDKSLFYCPSGIANGPESGTWIGGQGEKDLGYSYNYQLSTPSTFKNAQQLDPSKIIIVCDSDDNNFADYAIHGQTHLSIMEPGHRHNHGANNLWMDMHVSHENYEDLIQNIPTWFFP